MPQNTSTEPEDHGGEATAEDGVVMLDGPGGVAVTMTPEAAEATGRALLDAAEKASGQSSDPKSS